LRYWVSVIFLFLLFPLNLRFTVFLIYCVPFRPDKTAVMIAGFCVSILIIQKTILLQVTYIFFHELTHALFTLLSSGKIYKFKVAADFGYIRSDKSNFFIRLSPYFFPMLPAILCIVNLLIVLIFKHKNSNHFFLYADITFLFFCIVLFSTYYYNIKLMKLETTDVSRSEIFLSALFIINCIFPFTGAMLHCMLNYEMILNFFGV